MANQIYPAKFFSELGRYQFKGDAYEENTPFMSGSLAFIDLQEGLSLHCGESTDLINMEATIAIPSGVYITLILDGNVSVAFDKSTIHIDTKSIRKRSYVHGVVTHVGENGFFNRKWEKGKSERKISVYVTHDWLHKMIASSNAILTVLSDSDKNTPYIRSWHPSKKSVLAAETILHTINKPDTLQNVQLLSQSLIIVYDALNNVLEKKPHRKVLTRHYDNMLQVTTLLHQPEFADVAIEMIAQHMALSVSTLQRQFKAVFGVSVDEYRRTERLLKAKTMLEKESANISQIASVCGYTSVSNFSTAFKKHFGISPKELRAKH